MRELESNVALRVADTDSADTFEVCGRGELHLSILIETMRREGFEIAVSKPQVIITERNGVKMEPVEYVVIDVQEEYSGPVIEALGKRRAIMSNMVTVGETRRLEYTMPTRAIFGLRGELLTLSRGTAVMSHTYYDHQPLAGEMPGRGNGALCASETGTVTAYALAGVEQRGRFFVEPGVDVYEGMVVGRANDDKDVSINVVRAKKLTNMRAAGTDENVRLPPADDLSLERAIEFIEDDELVEVTPKALAHPQAPALRNRPSARPQTASGPGLKARARPASSSRLERARASRSRESVWQCRRPCRRRCSARDRRSWHAPSSR